MNRKNTVYVIIGILVISIVILIAIYMINKNNVNNIDNENGSQNIKQNDVQNMSDEELIQNTLNKEERLDLDTPQNDNLTDQIDSILNEKNPLDEIPEE